MKANTRLDRDIVDNDSLFTDPFFQQFQLRPRPEPLVLKNDLSRVYRFPTFYADVSCAIAIFLCDYRRAEAILPDPSMKPVRMPRSRAVVLFSCYIYRNVMNLAPYNEIAMTIPIMVDGGFSPHLLPLVMDFKKKGYFVFSMPVTSLENQIRGTSIWGLPKIVEEIDITSDQDTCTTVAKDDAGETYFELSVPKLGAKKHFDEAGYLYSVLEGQRLKSRTCFKGDFAVTTNPALLWSKGKTAADPALKLGSSPRADVLRNLKIEPTAFQFRYAERMNSCFDLPIDHQSISPK